MANVTDRILSRVSELAEVLKATGAQISEAEAGLLISGFVFEQFGRTLRRFDYSQPFPAEVPACAPAFQRSFVHLDWTDGESVVQAGTTPTEAGFNQRFHQIEADLDALWENIRRSAGCLSDMRKELRTLLDEIRAEINQINSEIHELRAAVDRPSGPPSVPPFVELIDQNKFRGTVLIDNKPGSLWETPQGLLVLPPITAGPGRVLVSDPRVNDGSVLNRHFFERPPIRERYRADPNRLTKKDLILNFGDERVSDGRMLRELLEPLPDDTTFADLDSVVEVVARADADRLRLMPGGAEIITNSFNEGVNVTRVADAPLSEARFLAPPLREALVREGVTTVGRMSSLGTEGVMRIMRDANVALTEREAAEVAASAKFLVHLR